LIRHRGGRSLTGEKEKEENHLMSEGFAVTAAVSTVGPRRRRWREKIRSSFASLAASGGSTVRDVSIRVTWP
jgi:hypothetical protein